MKPGLEALPSGPYKSHAISTHHQETARLRAGAYTTAFAGIAGVAQEAGKKSGLGELVASIPDVISRLKKKKDTDV